MKFSTRHIFLALLLAIFSASALPLDELFARGGGRGGGGSRGGGGGNRTGASPRVNSGTNLQNKGNINTGNVNRGNANTGNVNRGNANTGNVNRGNVNTGNVNRGNVNTGNVNRGNVNTGNVNRGNINVGNVNVNTGWRGGGWYGGGYATPPGWGLAALTTGLVIGSAINTLPPYYSPVVVGDTSYIYSDGVFLEPSGSSYIVSKPPIGAIVPSIPDGCTTTDIEGVVYYDCSGVIYQPFYQGSDLVYKVVRY